MFVKLKHKVTGTVYFVKPEIYKMVALQPRLATQYQVCYLVAGTDGVTKH